MKFYDNLENIRMCKWRKNKWCCKCQRRTWWILWTVYIVVLNVVDMMSLYSSLECCRHDENDLSKHGFEGHTSGKQKVFTC